MKKKLLFFPLLLISASLWAKEPTHSVSPTSYFEQKSKQKAPTAMETHIAAAPARVGQSEVMIIQPEMRAKDIEQAYQYLKTMNSASKVAVKLTNGAILTEIINIKVMPGGTMLIFQINSTQGQKFRVVKIEDIDTITDG